MSPQELSLIVPVTSLLSAVLVVLISSGATIWSKRVDVRQRQEDRNQELRKLYVGRKIEAGEMLIGQWTLIMNKLDWLRSVFEHHDFDKPLYGEEHERFQALEEKINSGIIPALFTEKNYALFYFDGSFQPVAISYKDASAKHSKWQRELAVILQERNRLAELVTAANPRQVQIDIQESLNVKRVAYSDA